MKVLLYLVLIASVLSCAKRTNARKVNNKLTEGKWIITEFVDNNVSIINKYTGIAMSFSTEGTVLTTSESGASGTWSVGSAKNPAILYMTFTEVDSLNVLTDDWQVTSLTKKECLLKRNNTITTSSQIASTDRLRLVKREL
jgi:hypothetical protein